MNFRVIAKYMGQILQLEGICMLPSILVALIYGETESILPFIITIALCETVGFILSKIKQNQPDSLLSQLLYMFALYDYAFYALHHTKLN